jgi:hypothetical protein
MSNEKKISIQPLKFDEAIADLLKVKPPKPQPKAGKKKAKPTKKAG